MNAYIVTLVVYLNNDPYDYHRIEVFAPNEESAIENAEEKAKKMYENRPRNCFDGYFSIISTTCELKQKGDLENV